jgi:hypothetical protein
LAQAVRKATLASLLIPCATGPLRACCAAVGPVVAHQQGRQVRAAEGEMTEARAPAVGGGSAAARVPRHPSVEALGVSVFLVPVGGHAARVHGDSARLGELVEGFGPGFATDSALLEAAPR